MIGINASIRLGAFWVGGVLLTSVADIIFPLKHYIHYCYCLRGKLTVDLREL